MFHISILFDNTSMLGGKIHLCRGWMGLGYWRWVEMGTHLSSTSSRRLTLAPQFCCVGLRSLLGRASLKCQLCSLVTCTACVAQAASMQCRAGLIALHVTMRGLKISSIIV